MLASKTLAALATATLFSGCATFATIDPKSTEAAVKKACSEEATNPAPYRNLSPAQGVRSGSYREVVQANLDCEKQLAATALYNEDAAKKNAALVWAGVGQGSGLTLGGVVLIVLFILFH